MSADPVLVFFYGSYMNEAVLADAGLAPVALRVASLTGYRLAVAPRANVVASPGQTVWGLVARLTHAELDKLYAHASGVLGETYLPEAVLVQVDDKPVAALCYRCHAMTPRSAEATYVDRVLAPALAFDLPESYCNTIAAFRPNTILLATHNTHKRQEVAEILADSGLTVVGLDTIGFAEDPPETAETFVANALQKAHYVHERTGLVVVADDSGLAVDALGGAPGVRSKRFTPEATAVANNVHLLERLTGISDRNAQFRCAIAVVSPWGEATAEGQCAGTIGTALRGDGGFGYDPLFLPDETPGRTMAELSPADKHAISHRGRAFAQLSGLLLPSGR